MSNIKSTEEMKSLLNEFLNDTNSYTGDYKGNNFLVIEGWNEHKEIEDFLSDYTNENGDVYDIDNLFNYESGFSDEYTNCYGCNKIVRTSPDSYGWQPESLIVNCELLCKECLDLESVIEEYANKYKKCIPSDIFSKDDLEKIGFTLIQGDFQNGFHEGMNDDPETILKKFAKDYKEIVFLLDDTSQFYIDFSAYGRNEASEED